MRMGIGLGVGINRSNYAQGIFASYQSRVVADGGTTEAGGCVDAGATPLLQTASLLLIPSGYKANKLYSEIPTNGNGDLTWARTSTAIRTNSSGLLESMATGVPRLSYMYGSCPSALLEPQRTNLVLQSNTFNTTWALFGGATITSNSTTSPDGSTNATTLNSAGGSNDFLYQSFVTSIGTTYAISFFVKNVNSTQSKFYIPLTATPEAFINWSGSTLTSVTSSATSSTFTSVGNGWYRVIVIVTSTTASYIFRIYSDNNNTSKSIYIYGTQCEAGAYPTTYIPTTSATATRVADSAVKTGISSLIGQTEGVLFWEGIVMQQTDIVAINRSTVNGIYIYKGAGNLFRTAIYHSSNVILFADTIVRNTNTKIAIAYKSGDSAMFVNGSKIGSTNTTALTFNGALSEIRLNDDFLIATAPQFTNKLAIYNTRLSDNDCIALTTL